MTRSTEAGSSIDLPALLRYKPVVRLPFFRSDPRLAMPPDMPFPARRSHLDLRVGLCEASDNGAESRETDLNPKLRCSTNRQSEVRHSALWMGGLLGRLPDIIGRMTCFCLLLAGLTGSIHSLQAQEPDAIEDIDFPEAVDFGMTSEPTYVPVQNHSWTNLFSGTETWTWKFMPKGFLYHTYLASEAEPRLATQLFYERNQGLFLDSFIGGRIGFVRFGRQDSPEGFQLDLLGGANLRQDPTPDWDVDAVQFRYDIPLTYRKGPHAWKFGFYHISAHLGDEFLLKNPTYPRLNWLRDSLYLGYSYFLVPELRLYGEAGWAFNSDVSEPWEFQFGFDYAPVYPTRFYGAPFIAMNGHLHQELNFGGALNIQAGWAWRGEGLNAGLLRTGPYYYNGASPQFSFYANHEQQFGWGLWYDF